MKVIKQVTSFLIFVMLSWQCLAQEVPANNSPAKIHSSSTAHRWQFHSINQVGLLYGENGSAFQVQTINGVQYKSWFAGIGVGIDEYRFRSIPLFADFRKEFAVGAGYLFIYGGIGMHFMWLTDKQKDDYHLGYYQKAHFSNGLYYDAGIGYKVKLNNRIAFFVSPGFSHKDTEMKSPTFSCPFTGPCYPLPERYNYALNRLSVNLGIIF